MIYTEYVNIKNAATHIVGNKLRDEGVQLSSSELRLDPLKKEILMKFFLFPILMKEKEFEFWHQSSLKLNEVYDCVNQIFDNTDHLFEKSTELAKLLYDQTYHPKIRQCSICTVYFNDFLYKGITVDGVGIFKMEDCERFLTTNGFDFEYQKGMNVNNLEFGVLVLNVNKDDGYVCIVVNNGYSPEFWTDEFLKIRQRKDDCYYTQNMVLLAKDFITKALPEQFEVSKKQQIEMLNKSAQYLKEHDVFDMQDFAHEVIVQPEVITCFEKYKDYFKEKYNVEVADEFDISEKIVKKQLRGLKCVIKLDDNFDIHIRNGFDLIESYEDDKGKYYKIYYRNEK